MYTNAMEKIHLKTTTREELIDITGTIEKALEKNTWTSGILVVYSPHTTAGITVNENADPNVCRDILSFLKNRIPQSYPFTHQEGNSDAHIKGSLVNFSYSFIVENGQVQLGTWQGIFFAEFDGPRSREVWLKFIADK